ncbi:hypothetical protein [Methylobacter sp. S3L5C]|uniref:hypothetical protein n=1 Tax=Methylobacter sp. S3L5C TaxID=2839024 RepID=UPI001FADFB37|nr:hypothetical protein [Methylobacter sp. S3L5C]
MKQDTNDQKNYQVPWNKGKLIGQKSPLKLKEIWAIRIRLQMAKNTRELALFNLAIDSKLRGCDLVKLRISDVAQNNRVFSLNTLKLFVTLLKYLVSKDCHLIAIKNTKHLTRGQGVLQSRILSNRQLSTQLLSLTHTT